jgi:hypothetical protein
MTTTATTSLQDLLDVFSNQATQAASQAAASGQDIWFSFLGLDWSTPTWDLVILLFFLISVAIYSFTLGRDRIVAILVATYLALAVTTNLPYIDLISDWLSRALAFTFQASAFLVVFAVLFVLLSRSNLTQSFSSLSGSWWQILLFSLLQIGLMTSVILSFLPSGALDRLSVFTQTIFVSDLGRFCWIVLPILALIFIRGRRMEF